MRKYRLVAKKGEVTFSEVLKAQNVKDGRYHAIKCMKNRFENIEQVISLYFDIYPSYLSIHVCAIRLIILERFRLCVGYLLTKMLLRWKKFSTISQLAV